MDDTIIVTKLFLRTPGLRQWRKDHDVTQQELADMLGVSQVSVSGWERGTVPTRKNLRRLAAAMKQVEG